MPAFKITAEPERFDEAVEYFRQRFPVTDEIAEALNQYAGDRAWKIAGVAQLDIVLQVYESLLNAITRGTPFGEWKAEIEAKLTRAWGRKDSPRVETIFRNATQQSYNAGRWRQINDPAVRAVRPYGFFDGIDDSRQSPICRECDGTILPLDDPWWNTHSPQLHHRCRSRVRSLTESAARRRGITTAPPITPADTGFGRPPTIADWEPDPADYPAPLWNEFERKAEQLQKRAGRKRVKPNSDD